MRDINVSTESTCLVRRVFSLGNSKTVSLLTILQAEAGTELASHGLYLSPYVTWGARGQIIGASVTGQGKES